VSYRGIAACGLLFVLAVTAGCGGDEAPEENLEALEGAAAADSTQPEPQDEPQGDVETEEVEEPSVEPLRQTQIEVYFPSASGAGLVGEFREIFVTGTPGDMAKQIISDLIEGPTGKQALRALPSAVRLRQAYMMESGLVYLDFSSELKEGLEGGSNNELLTIFSIVNSVVLNVAEIKRVVLLVGGRPVETLNGHVDLTRPLKPDFSLVRGSIIARGPG